MTIIATHLIKVKGTFDKDVWGYNEEDARKKIREYVDNKIREDIESIYHADLELFQINDNNIEVWVFISAHLYEVSKIIVEKWVKDHIKEKGIIVEGFEIEEKYPDNNFLVLIP